MIPTVKSRQPVIDSILNWYSNVSVDSETSQLPLRIKRRELQRQEAAAPNCSEKHRKKTRKKKLLRAVNNSVIFHIKRRT